jgi:hypothetical protein
VLWAAFSPWAPWISCGTAQSFVRAVEYFRCSCTMRGQSKVFLFLGRPREFASPPSTSQRKSRDMCNGIHLLVSAPAPVIITTMTFMSFIGRASANNVARMKKNDIVSLSQVIKRNYKWLPLSLISKHRMPTCNKMWSTFLEERWLPWKRDGDS